MENAEFISTFAFRMYCVVILRRSFYILLTYYQVLFYHS